MYPNIENELIINTDGGAMFEVGIGEVV